MKSVSYALLLKKSSMATEVSANLAVRLLKKKKSNGFYNKEKLLVYFYSALTWIV